MTWIPTINALIFIMLSTVHAYWALGGKTELTASLPTDSGGTIRLRPTVGMTWTVALGLLLLAGLSALHLFFGPGHFPVWLRVADGSMAAIFGLRAVGDFRYVGLSKRIHGTTFARRDSRYYTPLCLLLAAGSGWLAVAP